MTLKALTLDDIRLVPADFSKVVSRKDCDTSTLIDVQTLTVPLISSNMDAVYSPELSKEVIKHGGMSCVHRFSTVEENIRSFKDGRYGEVYPFVSVGIGPSELERFEALVKAGAETVVLDVANAASIEVVKAYDRMYELSGDNIGYIIGNFCTGEQIAAFRAHSKYIPTIFKIGIGNGSACETTKVTGMGLPTATTILRCKEEGGTLILDGGIKNSGDLAKAIALGADAVFVGRLFAACEESGAQKYITFDDNKPSGEKVSNFKVYRGSASASSYETQGKTADHRTPEGAEYLIPVSGTVEQFIKQMKAGLQSSMSYNNAITLTEFRRNAKIIEITQNGLIEGTAYGRHHS